MSDLEKFPTRYDIHKYLGRKPWYVVDDIISKYTSQGDTVLDLFSGSGVAAFEALKLKRNVIAVDHSSLSEIIVKSLCNKCDVQAYRQHALQLISNLKKMESLYHVRVGSEVGTLKYWIPNLNSGKILFKNNSLRFVKSLKNEDFIHAPLDSFSWQHANDKIPYIEGSNVSIWSEIFTKRSQYVLSKAFSFIMKVKNPKIRMRLLVAFSASIEKISLLNKFKSDSKGWLRDKPLCYYKPEEFIEFNSIDALENKLIKMESTLTEINSLLANNSNHFNFTRERVENLTHVNNADLIIMDPPYLSEVPYDKLEALQDIWLKFKPEKQDIQKKFQKIVLKTRKALKSKGILVLLMSNYLPASKKFFINNITQDGFIQINDIEKKGSKKEGLSITVFQKEWVC
jgi:16S rRNA G966 N2-methylase RsmD